MVYLKWKKQGDPSPFNSLLIQKGKAFDCEEINT